jgi:hypothetical protein
VDFVRRWSERTEIGAGRFIAWLDVTGIRPERDLAPNYFFRVLIGLNLGFSL